MDSRYCSIIQETDEWLAVNKAANVAIHHQDKDGLVHYLKKHLSLNYLAPVHRLDSLTSGCLLLAKTSQAANYLSTLFAERKIEKIYIAITTGRPKKKQGKVVGDLIKSRSGSYKLSQNKTNPSITNFKSIGFQNGFRIAIVKPITGKTHQIRVALKTNGCPIWGDQRYGKLHLDDWQADRGYLHSYSLSFVDQSETRVELTCRPQQGKLFQSNEFWSSVDTLI